MLHRRQEDRLEVFSRKRVFCFSSEEKKEDLAETLPKTPTSIVSWNTDGFGQVRAHHGNLALGTFNYRLKQLYSMEHWAKHGSSSCRIQVRG